MTKAAADPKLTKSIYQIHVEGQELDPVIAKRIRGVRVDNFLMLPDVCTFTVGFPKAKPEEPQPIDDHPFTLTAKLEVKLGARKDLAATTLFKGEIITLEPNFGGGAAEMNVRAFDKAHRLQRGRHVRAWQNQSADDIVSAVCKDAGLQSSTKPTGIVFEFMQQNNETDWDFCWRLADRVGFIVYIDDDTLHFEPAKVSKPIPLEWPKDIAKFSPRVTAIQQVDEVTVGSWDPKAKSMLNSTKNSPNQIAEIGVKRNDVMKFPMAKTHIASEPTSTQDESDKLAQALLDRLANGYVQAEGETTDGNPKLKAGSAVEISGVGKKFSGVYFVHQCSHFLSGGSNYTTQFANSPVPTITTAMGGGGGRVPLGLQLIVGKVTQNEDPESLGRVRVEYPQLADSHEGWWAKVAVPSAGAERGLSMLPVPGEQVLVGFENGDMTRPYVLGSLFNTDDKPGQILAAKDGSFGLKSDKKIEMHCADEMIVKTDKDLTITVQGNTTHKYTGDFKQDSQGAIEFSGSQAIKVKAGTSIELKGSASVSIESSGTLDIKGNMVTIDGGPMLTLKGAMINIG